MGNNTLPSDIAPIFEFLFEEYGFSIIQQNEYPETFGNWYADIESRDLRLRLGLDRDQAFLNIGSPLNTNNTFDLSIIIALIDGADPLEICDMYDFSDFRVLALIFKKHYTEIANLFKSENLVITETSLANLREERTLRMFPTLFVKNDDG